MTDDLRFDYLEDELDFWFDDTNAKYLCVYVQDHVRMMTMRSDQTTATNATSSGGPT